MFLDIDDWCIHVFAAGVDGSGVPVPVAYKQTKYIESDVEDW